MLALYLLRLLFKMIWNDMQGDIFKQIVALGKVEIRILEQDMTNTMLRERVKVSGSTFSKLKHNQYVSLEILERIAKELDCDIGDIVEIAKEKKKQ